MGGVGVELVSICLFKMLRLKIESVIIIILSAYCTCQSHDHSTP